MGILAEGGGGTAAEAFEGTNEGRIAVEAALLGDFTDRDIGFTKQPVRIDQAAAEHILIAGTAEGIAEYTLEVGTADSYRLAHLVDAPVSGRFAVNLFAQFHQCRSIAVGFRKTGLFECQQPCSPEQHL